MAKKITQNVNKDKFLNDLPKVSPEYSKWMNRWSNYQSCNQGQIVPIYYKEVLPGERKKVTMGMISHLTTPVAPIFPAGYTEIRSFFVPMRLCADLLNGYRTRKSPWVKVFGEDNANTSSQVIVPLDSQKLPNISGYAGTNFAYSINGVNTASKDNVFNSLDLTNFSNEKDFNYLNLAAYELIYQRHYRNENYEAATDSDLYKLLFNAYNTSSSFTIPNTFRFEMANREKDYFTGAKPFTLKASAPISAGLTGYADVGLVAGTNGIAGGGGGDSEVSATNATSITEGTFTSLQAKVETANLSNENIKIVADLKSVNGISIEDLRILIKTQELLEKDAMYGSLYAMQLNSHFSCCPLDLTLQDPQELFKTTITSHVQAIFQTSSTSGEASILGTIGANSTTQTDPFVIVPETKFLEHGILMICAVHKLQNVYDSNYFKPKFIYKKARFDFYTPELNDLGFMPISSLEMRSSSNPVAGYNEAFADYRYSFNTCHGELNNSFPYWAPSIANEYSSIAAMYKEGTAILDKALSIKSTTAPQFYDAWGFEEENTKPMSLHSIPGMDGVI